MDLREIDWYSVDWIHLTGNRNQWQALENMVMKCGVHKRCGISWLAEWLLVSPRSELVTKWSPARVSAPYSIIMIGLLYLWCHDAASAITLLRMVSVLPVLLYQPLYRLNPITSKCWPSKEDKDGTIPLWDSAVTNKYNFRQWWLTEQQK